MKAREVAWQLHRLIVRALGAIHRLVSLVSIHSVNFMPLGLLRICFTSTQMLSRNGSIVGRELLKML